MQIGRKSQYFSPGKGVKTKMRRFKIKRIVLKGI